ncbi:MAG: GNAT family N-acetyltransferase [Elusimicrobiota bacterium]|jgi:RimJ/RimL family protein N-acetyltransferase|nr:GNAT family N-acetyltransferase [Elusimicrobiota bacterium]
MEKFLSGRSINIRDVCIDDAEFILSLRTDESKNKFLNKTENDLEKQREYIRNYKQKQNEWYFIVETKEHKKAGTVRIYDVIDDDFCWGSWLMSSDAPPTAAIESALLVYEFAFYKVGFTKAHFDVRKHNEKVIAFHKRFGAKIIAENEMDYFFSYTKADYENIRLKYRKFLL